MKEIVDRFRRYLIHIGLGSFVIDMLALAPMFYLLTVMQSVVPSRSNETLLALAIIALYAVGVMALLDGIRSRLLSRFGATLRTEVAPTLLTLNFQVASQTEASRQALDDLYVLEGFVTGSGIRAFFEIPWIPVMLWILFLFHPALMTTALVLVAMLVVLTILEDRLVAPHQQKAVESQRRSVQFANIARQNLETVSALGMQEAIVSRWARLNESYLYYVNRANRVSSVIGSLAKFVRVAGQMAGLTVGAWLLINLEGVTAGVMVAALLLMGRTLGPIDRLINTWQSFVNARRAYARLEGVLDEVEANKNPDMEMPRPLGQLTVERLQVTTAQGQQLLKGVDFRLAAGESLGVIGPSGAGKSSLARALVGLVKPADGHVRLDGADVFHWAQSGLGRHVGYLPQDVVLFPGTIAENIARMQDQAANNDAIIAAAKRARVHSMILSLPKGYGTEVGEGGARLSGGQRQMVGLARTLYGSPSLLVLDEPNASLDSAAEAALMEVIRSLRISRVTVVVIAHNPRLIREMDKVLVLRNGEQTAFGDTDEVLNEVTRRPALAGPANGAGGSGSPARSGER